MEQLKQILQLSKDGVAIREIVPRTSKGSLGRNQNQRGAYLIGHSEYQYFTYQLLHVISHKRIRNSFEELKAFVQLFDHLRNRCIR
jgi:hypothetical protein